MKLNLYFAIFLSLVIITGCNNTNQSNNILTPKYDDKTRKYGYINQHGRLVIPFRYDSAKDFSEELAAVEIDITWGFIDKTGKTVIPLQYLGVGDFSEGLAVVQSFDAKLGFIDKAGNEVIQFKYDYAGDFSGGLAFVSIDRKWGCIDMEGNETIPLEYPSSEMIFICKNLLTPHSKQIMDYRSTLKKTSRSSSTFRINQPYIHVIAHSDDCMNMSLSGYSDNYVNKYDLVPFKSFDDDTDDDTPLPPPLPNPKYMHQFMQFVNSVKTLIIEYEYDDYNEFYNGLGYVTSIGSYLIYFDLDSKQCIGFDNVPGPALPRSITWSGSSLEREHYKKMRNKLHIVPDKIKTRLVDSE